MEFNFKYFNSKNISKFKKKKFFNNNTLLHYAVLNNKYNTLKNIINNDYDINQQNNNGDTALHLSIRYKYDNISLLLIENKKINLKLKNKYNIDVLFEAITTNNFNIINNLLKKNINFNSYRGPNNKNYFHEAIIKNNKKLIKYFISIYNNLNIKDSDGNSLIHYAAIYNNLNLIKNFKEKNINLNPLNNKNENPLNYYIKRDSKKQIINNLYNNNINDIDINENNCLINYLLYNPKIDKQIINIFIDYKINLYHCNKNDLSALTILIIKKDFNNFKFLINFIKDINYVSQNSNPIIISYLQNEDSPIDIKFLRELFIKKYDLNNPNIFLDTSVHYLCEMIIDNNLKNNYLDLIIKYKGNFFIQNRKSLMPIEFLENDDIKKDYITLKYFKKKICITDLKKCIKNNKIIQNDINILKKTKKIRTTFQGTGINEIFGLLYLLKKYKNDCSPISDNLSNLDYSEYGLDYNISTNKLKYNSNYIDNFLNCKKNKKIKFIITPLRLLDYEHGGHANYLIYNKNLNELERFDPYGNIYNNENIDYKINEFYTNFIKNVKYLSPIEYCPHIGIQEIQELELTFEIINANIGDPMGFCSAWSIWYTDMRLNNPKMNREILIKKAIHKIKKEEKLITNFIRNYAEFIINERDKLLRKININDIVEEKLSKLNLNKIINYLNKEIKKLILKYTS
jgi:ankyrin repeat protein